MRISDWSSDVCSSDLCIPRPAAMSMASWTSCDVTKPLDTPSDWEAPPKSVISCSSYEAKKNSLSFTIGPPKVTPMVLSVSRSEEHTSELQSLMRSSYAVFCLKKKKNKKINTQS